MSAGIDRLFEKMSAAYGKPCGFFDPTLPHGGPNPNSNRKKRAAFAEKVRNCQLTPKLSGFEILYNATSIILKLALF